MKYNEYNNYEIVIRTEGIIKNIFPQRGEYLGNWYNNNFPNIPRGKGIDYL